MSFTITEAVAYVKEDFSDVSANQTLAVMQQACNKLAGLYPLWTSTHTFSALEAGTHEYAYAVVPASVRSARYLTSSTDAGVVLRATTVDELDNFNGYWRGYQNSTPTQYYTLSTGAATNLGIVAAPAVTSSASYPQVQVYCWDYALLAFNAATGYVTSLPSDVVCADAVVYETMFRCALRVKDPNAAFYHAQAVESLRNLRLQTLGKSVAAAQAVVPSSMTRGTYKV